MAESVCIYIHKTKLSLNLYLPIKINFSVLIKIFKCLSNVENFFQDALS